MTLAAKFGLFKRKTRLDETADAEAVWAVYVAGAQAAFQILAAASEKTAGDAVIVWGELQTEILNALPKIELPPEHKVSLQ